MQNKAKKQAELQKQAEVLETIAKNNMTKEAVERYGNLKSAHPEKALHAVTLIVQLIQTGQLHEKLSDEDFKQLLTHFPPQTKFRIKN